MLLEVLDTDLLEGVRTALTEDIGSGDITAALVPPQATTTATVICREPAVICGMAWFNAVFAELDTGITVDWQARDGDRVAPDQHICSVSGPAAPILTGERTALNFLQTLSGTATLARRYADAVSGLAVRILDTRKTLPGLRQAQKYAVRTGGCHNHRHGLYDSILIKENHITAAGSIEQAVRAARAASPGIPVEIEVEDLAQVDAALAAGSDRLLLDNFTASELATAVEQVAGRAQLEASGGIDLDNIRTMAATGVDMISIGALTKNVNAVDFSMLFQNNAHP
jgi:nicotinate-nucleotide pyrophosphorylase (carboxylating)